MSDRADRLLGLLPGEGLDMMLVTDLLNVRYMTGFTGSNGLALVGPQTRTFVTDFRYVEQAAEEVDPSYERLRAAKELLDTAAEALPDGALRLGFEDAALSVREHQQAALAAAAAGRARRRRIARGATTRDQGSDRDRGDAVGRGGSRRSLQARHRRRAGGPHGEGGRSGA